MSLAGGDDQQAITRVDQSVEIPSGSGIRDLVSLTAVRDLYVSFGGLGASSKRSSGASSDESTASFSDSAKDPEEGKLKKSIIERVKACYPAHSEYFSKFEDAGSRQGSRLRCINQAQEILFNEKPRRLLQIYGYAGSGKTELAIEIGLQYQQNFQESIVLWIEANKGFNSELNKFLPEHHPLVVLKPNFLDVIKFFDSKNTLFIFNNVASEQQTDLDEALDAISNGSALITSRPKLFDEGDNKGVSFIEAPLLDESEAIAVFRRGLASYYRDNPPENSADFESLVDTVGLLPVTVAFSASYIANYYTVGTTVESFIAMVKNFPARKSHHTTQLDSEEETMSKIGYCSATLEQLAIMSVNRLIGSNPKILKVLIAILAISHETTPLELIRLLADDQLNETFLIMGKSPLFSSVKTTIKMHPLLISFAKEYIFGEEFYRKNKEDVDQYLCEVVDFFCDKEKGFLSYDYYQPKSFSVARSLMPYVWPLCDFLEKMEFFSDKSLMRKYMSLLLGLLKFEMCYFYDANGVINLGNKIRDWCTKIECCLDESYKIECNNILAYAFLYKYKESKSTFYLDDARRLLDETADYPEGKEVYAFSLSVRGLIMLEQHDLDNAIAVFKKSKSLREEIYQESKNFGSKMPIAISCSNLGRAYYEKGRIEDAAAMLRENICIYKDMFQSDAFYYTPTYSLPLCSLARCYEKMNRYEDAIQCYQDAIRNENAFYESEVNDSKLALDKKILDCLSRLGKKADIKKQSEIIKALEEKLKKMQSTKGEDRLTFKSPLLRNSRFINSEYDKSMMNIKWNIAGFSILIVLVAIALSYVDIFVFDHAGACEDGYSSPAP